MASYGVLVAGPGVDESVQGLGVLESRFLGGEAWVCGPGRRADSPHEALPLVVAGDADRHPAVVKGGVQLGAVLAAIGAVRAARPRLQEVALWRRGRAVDAEVEEGRADERGHGFELSQVDPLAFAGVRAVLERGQDGDGAGDAAGVVGVRVAEALRRAAGKAHEMGHPRKGLERGPVANVVAPGAGVTGTGHGDADDAGVDCPEALVVHAPALHDAGAEVVDDHI